MYTQSAVFMVLCCRKPLAVDVSCRNGSGGSGFANPFGLVRLRQQLVGTVFNPDRTAARHPSVDVEIWKNMPSITFVALDAVISRESANESASNVSQSLHAVTNPSSTTVWLHDAAVSVSLSALFYGFGSIRANESYTPSHDHAAFVQASVLYVVVVVVIIIQRLLAHT